MHNPDLGVDIDPGGHLGSPDRGTQPAQFVDQTPLGSIGPGPHPSPGDAVHLGRGEVPALRHTFDEVGVEEVGLGLDMRVLLLGERRIG